VGFVAWRASGNREGVAISGQGCPEGPGRGRPSCANHIEPTPPGVVARRAKRVALEDLAGDVGVLDGGDEPHARSAPRPAKRVHLEYALEEFGPGQPSWTRAST
jgi:hypothetical protein